MKKITLYIIIFIAFIGLLSPIAKVHATTIEPFYFTGGLTGDLAGKEATSGTTITLHWNSDSTPPGVGACGITGGGIPIVDGKGVQVPASGSYPVSVSTTQLDPEVITFTIECHTSLGLFNPTKQLNVKVNPSGILPSIDFQAFPHNPIPIDTQTVKLNWITNNIKSGSCMASTTGPSGISAWTGPKDDGGTQEIPFSDGTLYKLTCTGIGVAGEKIATVRTVATAPGSEPPTTLGAYVDINGCGFGTEWFGGEKTSIYPGCFITMSYGLFYVIPSALLWLSAYVFNVLISVTLHSNLFTDSAFIPKAWGVVRDLSNIFFILILLYIAVKLILGLGGSEVKKMIAKVIVVALLINFSMFFTGVVIDSSNILANIFYNKLSVNTKNADGSSRPYESVAGDIDVAGGMVNAFDPTRLLNKDFFENGGTIKTIGTNTIKGPVSYGLIIMVTIVAGLLMSFAAYAFLWAGLAFLSRMVELFILIIFSPFAFMSSSIPLLGHIEYLGWESWLKRLLKTSFMAPIFMFFMYFIFLLINTKPSLFDSLIVKSTNSSVIEKILIVVIPALLILILLLKATEFAKKGSGKIGEVLMTGVKMAGGLALGAVTGGTALLGTKVLGGIAANRLASNGETWRKQAEKGGLEGLMARMKLKTADYGSRATYDIRGTGAGKLLTKESGMNLSRNIVGLGPKEGGFKGAGERRAAELKKESELYKTTKSDAEVAEIAAAKLAEYEEKKNKAKEKWISDPKNTGKNESDFDKEYEEENGKPIFPQTANELNNERMRAFSKNVLVGSRGLLGAMAYQYRKGMGQIVDNKNYETDEGYRKQFIKKHGDKPIAYDANVANEVNRGRVEQTKMIVGGVAGVGIGAFAARTSGSSREGEKKFSKDLEKGIRKMSKVTDTIAENTKVIKNLESVLANGNNLLKDYDEKPIKLVNDDGTTNAEEIEKQLTKIANIDEMNKIELRKLYEQGLTEKDKPVRDIIKMSMDNAGTKWQLSQLKTAPDDIHKRKTENVRLSERQEKIEDSQKSPANKPKEEKTKTSHSAKPTTSTNTSSTSSSGSSGSSGGSGGGAHPPAEHH
jgi:hypothetical protein